MSHDAQDERSRFVGAAISQADVDAIEGTGAAGDAGLLADADGVDVVTYMLNTDAEEKKRLHTQHVIFRTIFSGLFQTPQLALLQGEGGSGAKVLDVGCGPGLWSVEMARTFQKSTFVGVDINGYEHQNLPDNISFRIEDVLKGLSFPDNTFDLVHQRNLLLGVKDGQWPAVIRELIRVTKPGGYIELAE
ncbi:hypothetical protein HK405_015709, partial [Cladochytrium tenue]